jgi:hypothetical protein
MVTIEGEKYYTVEEVVDISGYQKNTIYNFTFDKVISPPVKGLTEADYQSQGLYREAVFVELQKYRELKLSGLKKREIVEHIKSARATANESLLPILEARG